ncbi:MAG: nucleotidyltransferase family protein [Moorellaceae bacterium]
MNRELGSGGTEYSTDWAAIRQSWKCRAQNKRQAEGERRNLALDRARAVARHLKERYRVKNVYLFGSLVWGKHFSPRSDIDLLVEGFPSRANYWRAVSEAEEIAAPFPVSLVLMEGAVSSLVDRVLREGMHL